MRKAMGSAAWALSLLVVAGCESAPTPTGLDVVEPRFSGVAPGGYEVVLIGDPADPTSRALGVNDDGEVVGWRFDASFQQRALYWSDDTGLIDISVPGSDRSTAEVINDQGQAAVAGRLPDGSWELHTWTLAGGHQLLASFPAGGSLSAPGMNDHGDVVGRAPSGDPFRWTAANGVELLSTFVNDIGSHTPFVAWDINDAGQITFRASTGAPGLAGYLWTPVVGSIRIFPSAYASLPRELNSSAQVAMGRWDDVPPIVRTGHRWSPVGSVATGPFDGTTTEMWGINEAGQVVGFSGALPVLWDDVERLVTLPTPDGMSGQAFDINGEGVVAGVVGGRAALWRAAVTSVLLDVKPGSDRNPINLKWKGKLPVAILSTLDFDATEIDVSTVLLGDGGGSGTPVATKKKGQPHASVEDVDGDGLADLMLHFDLTDMIANGDIGAGSTELCVSGATASGDRIEGCDQVDVK